MSTTKQIRESAIDYISRYKELILTLPLSISIFRIFFSQRRASVFDVVTLGMLLIWRYLSRDKLLRSLPKLLIISACLIIISDFASALLSDDPSWELAELRKYFHVFIGVLLFILPLEDRTRRIMIFVFLAAAAVAGGEGIWQYFREDMRSQGSLPHALLFAETLALAWGSTLCLLIFEKRHINERKKRFIYYSIVFLVTLGGILFSEARGVWIGLFIATSVVLILLFDIRMVIVFLLFITVLISVPFYYDNNLRGRAKSIITSVYAEDEHSSAGTRIELWKGAFLIFGEHPVLGSGSGNFESNIERLVKENKIRKTETMVHAHSIYLQALATRGGVGFSILVAFLVSLMAWGIKEIKIMGGLGGYIIIFCTVLTIVGGLTEDNLGTTKYLAAYCFTIGLLGPLREPQPRDCHD